MKTAVVVDDEPIMRLDLCEMLKELNFDVVGSAADGFDAVELCKRHNPDIVLMDINMPVFDGLSSTEKIIKNNYCKCVIIITAYGTPDMVERAARAGVSGYLVKPIDKNKLYPAIEVALAQADRQREKDTELEDTKTKIRQQKIIDRAKVNYAKQNNMSEADAYRELQKMAMAKRCSMIALAEAMDMDADRRIIDTAKQILIDAGMSESAAYKRVVANAKRDGISMADAAYKIISSKGKKI